MDQIRVAVLGVCGRMGKEVAKAVIDAPDMTLVGACDVFNAGQSLDAAIGLASGVVIEECFDKMLESSKPQVVVDFAKPFSAANIVKAIRSGAAPVVGTTGQSQADIELISKEAEAAGVGALIAPNFAVGGVLMMKFAAEAAKYMPCVEIIELHHDKKLDSPSGTAIKTSIMIDEARREAGVTAEAPLGGNDPARGDEQNGVHIHSVRLPGLVAHQEVLFGGTGQILTIRHDSLDRTSFMPGVLLGIRKILDFKGLVYGLDKLM